MLTFLSPLILASALFACGDARRAPELTADNSSMAAFLATANQTASDDALLAVRRLDQSGLTADGQLARITPAEHVRRAGIYFANRAFDDARRHWQALIARYPDDPAVSASLFSLGRSYFQERKYSEALDVFEQLGRRETQSKEGRDGFYYVAPTLLRLNRPLEAAARYREYINRFPQGERLADAHLNVIDSLREGGDNGEAVAWVTRTRERFMNTPVATQALFARLRLDIATGDFAHAVAAGEELQRTALTRGAITGASTNAAEVAYLRAYSLEKSGRRQDAATAYLAIPEATYYGALATKRSLALFPANTGARARDAKARQDARITSGQYPAPHRETILRYAAQYKVDPRLLLAIMKQESGFNARAKSPAAARGLMQLTFDAATKYAATAGLKDLREDDLYRPEVSIQLACAYLSALGGMFPNLPEAVAASYNGGEDNVARWVKRANQPDPGVFAAEVGFAETKDYVFKVIGNYRTYSQLYSPDLRPRQSAED